MPERGRGQLGASSVCDRFVRVFADVAKRGRGSQMLALYSSGRF